LTQSDGVRYNEKMKRLLRWTSVVILTSVALYFGASWIYAQRLTRARPSSVGAPSGDFPYLIESVAFSTRDDHTLAGWLVPSADPEKAIILLHGWGGNRKQMLRRAQYFREHGYTALLYDARACGESSGDAVTFGYRERADLIAAVGFLKQRGSERIACLGVSQGGATICLAADELKDVKCVICESVYDEMINAIDRRMRRYTGVPGWLGGGALVPIAEHRLDLSIDDVKPVANIGKLPCPVLLISGERDDRVWIEDARRLFDAANEPKELWMIPDARHEDLFRFDGYKEKVNSFIKRHIE